MPLPIYLIHFTSSFITTILLGLLCFFSREFLSFISPTFWVLNTLIKPAIRPIGCSPSHISWIHSIVIFVWLLGINKWGIAAFWSRNFLMLTLHFGLRWMASSYNSLRTKLSLRQETQLYSYSGSTPFMLLFLLNIREDDSTQQQLFY